MRVQVGLGRRVGAIVVALLVPLGLSAQGVPAPVPVSPFPPPVATVSMADAVRLALERNQTLRAQRLTIDESKADEITADLKPNFNFSFSAAGLSPFSPTQFTFNTANSAVFYDFGLGYTFERGGKRDKRFAVARETTDVTAKGVMDAERQLRFQTEQAFINVLLAKSTLDLSQQNLKNFSQVVEVNQQRVTAGDLAEGDFLPISIQKLQFETDVSAAEVGLVQARAALRQFLGFDSVSDDFDVTGELTHVVQSVTIDDLRRDALASRPDLLAAQSGLLLAQDSATLQRDNRARDVSTSVDYTKAAGSNTLGVGVSFDLPFRDRNQGNILHADIATRQAAETEAAVRFGVLTDVTNAFAAFQTSEKILKLYESGYLDQTQRSLDITTYAFQRGATSLLNLLDAERTYRDTQVAYRQALATHMTNIRQLTFVVGK